MPSISAFIPLILAIKSFYYCKYFSFFLLKSSISSTLQSLNSVSSILPTCTWGVLHFWCNETNKSYRIKANTSISECTTLQLHTTRIFWNYFTRIFKDGKTITKTLGSELLSSVRFMSSVGVDGNYFHYFHDFLLALSGFENKKIDVTQLKLFFQIILSLCYKLKVHFKLEPSKLLTVSYLRHY